MAEGCLTERSLRPAAMSTLFFVRRHRAPVEREGLVTGMSASRLAGGQGREATVPCLLQPVSLQVELQSGVQLPGHSHQERLLGLQKGKFGEQSSSLIPCTPPFYKKMKNKNGDLELWGAGDVRSPHFSPGVPLFLRLSWCVLTSLLWTEAPAPVSPAISPSPGFGI